MDTESCFVKMLFKNAFNETPLLCIDVTYIHMTIHMLHVIAHIVCTYTIAKIMDRTDLKKSYLIMSRRLH